MDAVVLVGRVVFAGLFLMSGIGHLTETGAMTGYAHAKGVPWARAAVRISGALILIGGLMVLLGVWADLGALLLVVFLVPTAFLMHGPWKAADEQEKQVEQVQFLKDLALAGAALVLFVLFSALPDLGLTITGPLFNNLWT